MLDRLGLPAWAPPSFKAADRATSPPMDPGKGRRPVAYFGPHNARLAALTGRDFAWD